MRPATFFLLASVALTPVTAQTTPADGQSKADKKICRTMEPEIGSHFPGKRVLPDQKRVGGGGHRERGSR